MYVIMGTEFCGVGIGMGWVGVVGGVNAIILTLICYAGRGAFGSVCVWPSGRERRVGGGDSGMLV